MAIFFDLFIIIKLIYELLVENYCDVFDRGKFGEFQNGLS